MVCTEDAKCKRFQQALELNIRSRISALEITRYAELVNNAKIVERDVKELSGRWEKFKKGRFDSGTRTSRPKILEAVTIRDQSQAQVSSKVGGAGANSLRGIRSVRARSSWRPPVRPMYSARTGSTRRITCYRCGGEGHIVRDCPMPWTDACYQCGQPGHIAQNCTQRPSTAFSFGSLAGGNQ